jgi:tetratricopeptide (TPR) repeat protein
LAEQFEFEEAERLLRANLETLRATLKTDDPKLISAIGEYGLCLERMRRPQEAEVLYKESLELAERNLGKYHPLTLSATNNFGGYLSQWRNQNEAIPVLRENIARYHHAYGNKHPRSIMAEFSLGASLALLGKYDEAIVIRESVVPRMVEVLGPDAELTVIAKAGLGDDYGHVGRLADALRLLGEAYRDCKPIANHEFIPTSYFDLCMKAKELDTAREVAQQQLELVNQRSPNKDVERRIGIWNLSRWFMELEDWKASEPLLRDCIEIRDKFERDEWDYWTVYSDRSNLGESLMKQGNLEEAEAYLNDGCQGLMENAEKIPATFRVYHIPPALRRLIEFHQTRHEPELVTDYQKKLEEYESSLK